MSGIFISYRREDSAGWTGRLSEHLRERFGAESIFMDIDTIQPGIDFTEALQKAVSSCEVLLAMIGPEWATVTGKSGKPRIEDPSDWVRTEIAAALKRKIRVIPVLVGGASVPTIDLLPDDLDALAQRQAHELTDKRWSFDVEQLVNTLPAARQKPSPVPNGVPWRSKPAMLGMLIVATAISTGIALTLINPSAPPPVEATGIALLAVPKVPPQPVSAAVPETIAAVTYLHAGQEARLKDHRATCAYKVLGMQVDRSWKDTLSLSVMVRVTNEGPMDTGFGDNNFRLLVDDVPRAPTSNLNDSVDPHSAKDGTIVFTFPVTAQRLLLQLRMGDDVAEIPVDVTKPIPPPKVIASPAQFAHLNAATFPIALHAGQEARLKDHRASCVYKVLAIQVDRSRPDTLSLSVTVQVTSEGPLDTGFGDSNFRLLVDDVPRTPTSRLSDSVKPHSAKEGTIVFTFPVTAKRLLLQLRMGDNAAEFPVDLSPIWS